MRWRWFGGGAGALALLAGSLWLWNYEAVAGPVGDLLALDPRNPPGTMSAHFMGYVDPNSLDLDLKDSSSAISCADLMRMLFVAAEAMRTRPFDRVLLARNGEGKFWLSGGYFGELGVQYLAGQNPVYLMRTLPQNVQTKDGGPAYPTWTGGVIGVLGKQMDDLNSFCRSWASS